MPDTDSAALTALIAILNGAPRARGLALGYKYFTPESLRGRRYAVLSGSFKSGSPPDYSAFSCAIYETPSFAKAIQTE